jgi:hypothetical protein
LLAEAEASSATVFFDIDAANKASQDKFDEDMAAVAVMVSD